jgi:hypothetical protein
MLRLVILFLIRLGESTLVGVSKCNLVCLAKISYEGMPDTGAYSNQKSWLNIYRYFVFNDIRNTICDMRGFLPVHCLDHILIALNEDTFFDLEGGSESAILNGEFLSDD